MELRQKLNMRKTERRKEKRGGRREG
jgi:hypothetical protein